MIRKKSVLPATALCVAFCFGNASFGQTVLPIPGAIAAVKNEVKKEADQQVTSDNKNTPKALAELIQASRNKYMEGYSLIRNGDCDLARKNFDAAVNLLLHSNWSFEKYPQLSAYLQELIYQIKEAESRYLYPEENAEELDGALYDDIDSIDLMAVSDNPEIRKAMAAGLAKNEYDIPITINEMVVKSLEFWLNRGKKNYADGLVRSGQYRSLIEQVFIEEAIPLDLINLAQVESFFKPNALSKAKAKGIWQFGKDTAIRYGLKVNKDIDERSDPEKSTRAAARYLNDLYKMFKDWNLVLAAYNWGEAKVKRLMDSTGVNDFWQLANLNTRLPEETRRHIPLIQASAILAKDPGKFGLPTELNPPQKYVKVAISKPIDLRAAAKLLSTSLDELKSLNPSIKGTATPANYPNFQLKVPVDSNPDVHEQLNALPKARIRTAPEFDGKYTVRKGDSLYQIAKRYHTTTKVLIKENGLSKSAKIKAGQILKVPVQTVTNEETVEKSLSAEKKEGSKKEIIKKSKKTGTKASLKKKSRKNSNGKAKAASAKNKKSSKKSKSA